MREVMVALAVSATCLMSSPARSEEAAPSAAAPAAAVPSASPRIKAQLAKGYRLRAAKKDVEALAAFKSVLAVDPQNHAALVESGYIEAGLKHWGAAVRLLAAASAQDADNMRLRMDLAYAHQALKQNDAAAEQFGVVAQRPGEFQDQAQKALDAIKGSAPSAESAADAGRRRTMEQGYAALKRGDRDAARAKFEAVVAADPKNAAAQKQLGFINLQDGKAEEAAANFQAARAVEPNDYFIALQLGYVYQRLQKKDEARDAFGAAVASTDPKIHDAAASALKPAAGETAAAPSTSL